MALNFIGAGLLRDCSSPYAVLVRLPSSEPDRSAQLEREHRHESIRLRLASPQGHSYLGDAVLGGIDGCVTTFAIVAAATGAEMPSSSVIILGLANLLADGFSMAVSNFQGVRTQADEVEKARATESRHIDEVPAGEREEVRQIFAAKGFEGDLLDRVVDVITSNRKVWIETMLREEIGVQPVTHNPFRAALSTFGAFLAVGSLPLLPFLFPANGFERSAAMAAIAFFLVGAMRAYVLERRVLTGGLSTVLTGGCAAAAAYTVGWWLHKAGVSVG